MLYYISTDYSKRKFVQVLNKLFKAGFMFNLDRFRTFEAVEKFYGKLWLDYHYICVGYITPGGDGCKMILHASGGGDSDNFITVDEFLKEVFPKW